MYVCIYVYVYINRVARSFNDLSRFNNIEYVKMTRFDSEKLFNASSSSKNLIYIHTCIDSIGISYVY